MKIKKFLLYILMSVMIISCIGCGNKEATNREPINDKFDIKAATNIAEIYMNYLVKEDYSNAIKLYSKKLSNNKKDKFVQQIKIMGYNIEEINEIGKSGVFKIKVARTNLQKPFASLEEYILKVAKDGKDYKVVDINISTDMESFIANRKIRLKNKNNVETNLLINSNGLPKYIYPKDDKEKLNKLEVPKKEYGPMVFSYSGDTVAISTYNKNSFAGVVKIDETVLAQGEEQKGQQGGNEENKNEESMESIKEKPVGKEIVALDILKDSKIEYMVFSKDEKLIAVQYDTNNKSKNIRVYNVDSGDLIPYIFEENYPIDKVNVRFVSFGDNFLNYEVLPINNKNKDIDKYLGSWQMDLKTFKSKKM